uniref:Membrane protein ORF59 n=1 Tax=Panagrellus redivivus TaxID=6233 RepID=A0A7E4V053_PANRE
MLTAREQLDRFGNRGAEFMVLKRASSSCQEVQYMEEINCLLTLFLVAVLIYCLRQNQLLRRRVTKLLKRSPVILEGAPLLHDPALPPCPSYEAAEHHPPAYSPPKVVNEEEDTVSEVDTTVSEVDTTVIQIRGLHV